MDWNYHVNPDIDIPIYTQLVDMLRSDIRSGRLPYGTKLPTVRELSDLCGIARGTVMRAYSELEQLRVIEKIQGRGTFVSFRSESAVSRMDTAMKAIDGMLDTLEGLNFSQSEISIYLNLKLRERAFDRSAVKLAAVASGQETINFIAAQLRSIDGVDVYSYHMDDIRAYPYNIAEDIDLFVTVSEYAEELRQILGEKYKVSRVALRLTPATVRQLVHIPHGAKVGIACRSLRFGSELAAACREYSEGAEVAEPVLLTDEAEQYVRESDILLVPDGREYLAGTVTEEQIRQFAEKKPVISCRCEIDEGSFMYLETEIDRLRERK